MKALSFWGNLERPIRKANLGSCATAIAQDFFVTLIFIFSLAYICSSVLKDYTL